ncbi:MAG: hypothetical protein FWE88_01955 [Phycisphaerae bacterium]|nr:hypothetical protein [Phycisphaerae bacterium]
MPDRKGRFAWVGSLSKVALILTLTVLAVALATGIAQLVFVISQGTSWTSPVAWGAALGVLLVLVVAAWAIVTHGAVHALVANATSSASLNEQVSRLETLLENQTANSRKIADLLTLSEQAKTLLYHDREVDAIREMVHQMLVRQDYTAAEQLISSVEQRPAYAQEAIALRKEVATTRQATIEGRTDLAVKRVEELIERREWLRAAREVAPLVQAYPTNAKVTALPSRIESAKARHKRDLLQAYGEAVRRNDLDASIDLLKQLDTYLTPQEAAALQDSARGVFRAKLHTLGVQFAIQVAEGQWNNAITVGEDIIRNFPNSRMAKEVLAKMDQLRANAAAKASV